MTRMQTQKGLPLLLCYFYREFCNPYLILQTGLRQRFGT
jgi:hypothetical protein